MSLPAGAIEVELVDGQATLLDHQPGPRALRGEPGLDLRLVVRAGLCREHQMMWRVADLDSGRATPGAGEHGLDGPADAQVAGHLGNPARESLRHGARLPQIVDVGVVDILHTHRPTGLVE